MGMKENFQKLIERKQDEIRELEVRVREAHAYLQALQDSVRLLPKEETKLVVNVVGTRLRNGSDLAQVRDVLTAAGEPMHVDNIMEKMGKEPSQQNRVSLVGTLGSYSRKGKVFTRPAPNTFGLIGMAQQIGKDEIPEEFGRMT